MRKINVLFTGAAFNSPNEGVNALSLGAFQILSHKYSDEFVLKVLNCGARSSPMQSLDIGNQTVQVYQTTSAQLLQSLFKATWQRLLPKSSHAYDNADHLLRLFKEADIVIDLSEGDSFTTIYGPKRILRQTLLKLPAIALRKKLLFLPQTIGPFDSFWARWLATFILKRASVVCTRDPFSTRTVKDMLKDQTPIVESSDLGFLLAPQSVEFPLLKEIPNFVGINISGLLYFHNDKKRFHKLRWSRDDYRQFMERVVVYFTNVVDKDVILIPHVRQPNLASDDDVRACQHLRDSLLGKVKRQVKIIEEPFSVAELKAIIGQAEFFIGARMHSCIAALSMCVPVVPVSYSYKFEGILYQMGLQELACNPEQHTIDEMILHIQKAYEDRSRIQQKLEQVIPIVKERALECVNYL